MESKTARCASPTNSFATRCSIWSGIWLCWESSFWARLWRTARVTPCIPPWSRVSCAIKVCGKRLRSRQEPPIAKRPGGPKRRQDPLCNNPRPFGAAMANQIFDFSTNFGWTVFIRSSRIPASASNNPIRLLGNRGDCRPAATKELNMSAMPAIPLPDETSLPQTYKAKAYAAQSATSGMAAITIPRRTPQPKDVQIEILYCGVCHTDVHFVHNDFAPMLPTAYPCVPGHEIVGRVTKAGKAVTKFKEGDLAAIGCMVDSDRTCESCREGEEQYCASQPTLTYNAPDKHLGGVTYGGYSQSVVVDEDFVLRVPKNLNLAATAPLLCAGITTYSPLRAAKLQPGQKVGVVGLGGLGHMGVKLASAFGADVVVFTTSPGKAADAIRLGAHEVVNSKQDSEMMKHLGTFDFI